MLTVLSEFRTDRNGAPQQLVISTGDSVLQWVVIPRLSAIRVALPGVQLHFRNLRTIEAVGAVESGEVDYAIIRSDAAPSTLAGSRLGRLKFGLFVPARCAATGRNHTFQQFADLPIIGLEGEGQLMERIRSAAQTVGVRLKFDILLSSFPAIAVALQSLDAIAVLPVIAAGPELVEIVTPFDAVIDRPLSLVLHPRNRDLRPLVRRAQRVLAGELRF